VKLVRPAVALCAGVLLLLAGSSSAAPKKPIPKPVCNLLSDDPADSGLLGPDADDNQEILGGDLATDLKNVTAVLTLAKAPGVDPISPSGLAYYVSFTVPGTDHPVYLGAQMSPTGALTWTAGAVTSDGTSTSYSPNAAVPVRGTVRGTSLVISADLKAFAALAPIKKGVRITGLTGETFGVLVVALTPFGSDIAEDSKPYLAGTPSCVKPA
jgi:hypothetical protein